MTGVHVFAFLVIGGILWILILYYVPWGAIEEKKKIREFERKKEIEREEEYRLALHKNFLKKQAKKLTSGYAVRRDGKIKKIPMKYLQAIKESNNAFTPDRIKMLKWEFFNEYPHHKL